MRLKYGRNVQTEILAQTVTLSVCTVPLLTGGHWSIAINKDKKIKFCIFTHLVSYRMVEIDRIQLQAAGNTVIL